VRAHVALVSHASFLYEDLTAEQNLLLWRDCWVLPSPKDAVQQVLERGEDVPLERRTRSASTRPECGKRTAIARLLLKEAQAGAVR